MGRPGYSERQEHTAVAIQMIRETTKAQAETAMTISSAIPIHMKSPLIVPFWFVPNTMPFEIVPGLSHGALV